MGGWAEPGLFASAPLRVPHRLWECLSPVPREQGRALWGPEGLSSAGRGSWCEGAEAGEVLGTGGGWGPAARAPAFLLLGQEATAALPVGSHLLTRSSVVWHGDHLGQWKGPLGRGWTQPRGAGTTVGTVLCGPGPWVEACTPSAGLWTGVLAPRRWGGWGGFRFAVLSLMRGGHRCAGSGQERFGDGGEVAPAPHSHGRLALPPGRPRVPPHSLCQSGLDWATPSASPSEWRDRSTLAFTPELVLVFSGCHLRGSRAAHPGLTWSRATLLHL